MIEQNIPKGLQQLAAVQADSEAKLLDMQNVVGVALGKKIKNGTETDRDCVSVLVSHKVDTGLLSRADKVPAKIKDVVTDVVEVGDIFAGGGAAADAADDMPVAQAAFSSALTRRMRPAQGGFSVGHFSITAGTLGTCCYDLTPFPSMPQHYYILSNNHVLAASNSASLGDPILQPGPIDGGVNPRDIIARLSRFVPIKFHSGTSKPCNFVDAAIAEGNLQDLNRELYWGGYVNKLYAAPKVNDIVQKTGRTTGFTTGKVTNINATVDVNYGGGRVARFCRQIITTAMSAPGDSGSLVTDRDEGAVGLLFAGSSVATIINNIAYVQLLLRVRVTEK
jgi:hypothetical protein